MTRKLHARRTVRALVLFGVLATLAIATATATAAPASQTGADQGSSVWPAAPAGETPSVSNDVGQPSAGTGSQLPLAIALIAAGVGALLVGFATIRRGPTAPRSRIRRVVELGTAAHSRAQS